MVQRHCFLEGVDRIKAASDFLTGRGCLVGQLDILHVHVDLVDVILTAGILRCLCGPLGGSYEDIHPPFLGWLRGTCAKQLLMHKVGLRL